MDEANVATTIAFGCVVVFLLGFGIKTYTVVPDATPALYDPETNTYVTEDCFEAGQAGEPFLIEKPFNNIANLEAGQIGDFRARHAKVDQVCRDSDGFIGERSSMSRDALRWLRRASYHLF